MEISCKVKVKKDKSESGTFCQSILPGPEQVLPMMIRLFKKVKVKIKTRKNENKLFDQSKMGKGARC